MTKRTKRILAMMSSKPKLRKISGLPPLTYTAKEEGTLKNYRIYGQTSRNLFDVTAQHTIAYTNCYEYIISGLNPNLNYTCSTNYNQEDHTDASIYFGGSVTRMNGVWQNEPKTYTPNNDGEIIILIRFIQYEESLPIYEAVVSGDIWIMVNEGDSPLPYEPYGESVGDRTGNLFDAEIVQGSFYANTGAFRDATNRIRSNDSDFIYLTTGTYTINADGVDDVVCYAYSSEDTSTFLYYRSMTSWLSLPCTFTVQTPCYFLFGFRFSDESDIIPSDISNIMLNVGSTALPYEPYGYKVPVTVSDGTDTLTTNLYLPEPLRMVGTEADYIDYEEQKEHFADGTSVDVTLPALPTLPGTNVLSVETEVQPSSVEIEGRIKPVVTGGG